MPKDLNLKKKWHPGTLKNQERVWLLEKKAEEEKKKTQQLIKEKRDEREREELMALTSNGKSKSSARLDWMYVAGPNTQESVNEEREAYLLGKKRIDSLIESKDMTFSKRNDSIYGMNANSSRDLAAKVREDPLLLIKKQEQLSLQKVLGNPLKMKQFKEIPARPRSPGTQRRSKSPIRRRRTSRSPTRSYRHSPPRDSKKAYQALKDKEREAKLAAMKANAEAWDKARSEKVETVKKREQEQSGSEANRSQHQFSAQVSRKYLDREKF